MDDRPNNNFNERSAFETLGLRFKFAASTEDALEILKREKFAVIISDMKRLSNPQAGYELLDSLGNDKTPFVIYSRSNDPEHIKLARQKGAKGSTSNPLELFTIVTGLILKQPDRIRTEILI